MKPSRSNIRTLILAVGLAFGWLTTSSASERELDETRLVSLVPALTEMVFVLGAGDQLVGATEYATWPAAAQKVRRVGGGVSNTLSLETVVALKPDFVLAGPWGQDKFIEALDRIGIPVHIFGPQSVSGVVETAVEIGELLGRESQARALQRFLRDGIRRVRASVVSRAPVTVFYEVWDTPLMTVGAGGFLHELIEMAGGRNVFSDLDRSYAQIGNEDVVARDPAVIVAPDRHGHEVALETLSRRPGWARIQAVQGGRIHRLNGDLISRPGPRVAAALAALANALHADLNLEIDTFVPPVPISP